MARKRKDANSPETKAANDAAHRTVLERVQELTWAMLDEQISDDEFRLLENLLLSDDEARETYVDCVQLHAGLMVHHAALQTADAAKKTTPPVLGFLNTGALGFQPQGEVLP